MPRRANLIGASRFCVGGQGALPPQPHSFSVFAFCVGRLAGLPEGCPTVPVKARKRASLPPLALHRPSGQKAENAGGLGGRVPQFHPNKTAKSHAFIAFRPSGRQGELAAIKVSVHPVARASRPWCRYACIAAIMSETATWAGRPCYENGFYVQRGERLQRIKAHRSFMRLDLPS